MDYTDVFASIIKEAVNADLADWYVDTYFYGNWNMFEDAFRREFGKNLFD